MEQLRLTRMRDAEAIGLPCGFDAFVPSHLCRRGGLTACFSSTEHLSDPVLVGAHVRFRFADI